MILPVHKSIPDKYIRPVLKSIRSNLHNVNPIGLGRCGDLVANKPTFLPPNKGGLTLALKVRSSGDKDSIEKIRAKNVLKYMLVFFWVTIRWGN